MPHASFQPFVGGDDETMEKNDDEIFFHSSPCGQFHRREAEAD
jgi:hypothetical protein